MRVVFFGTPEFALPALEGLAREHEIAAVVTQQDRPRGRGRRLMPGPVKKRAEEMGLTVYQPRRLKDDNFLDTLRKFDADYFVVVAYGRILPKVLLDIPRFGCLNIHPSLLPKYRGPAPVNWAIINGDRTTGVTIMELDEGMDTGPIVLQQEVDISEDITAGELLDITARMGADMLLDVLRTEEKQGHPMARRPQMGEPSTAPLLEPSLGHIDWNAEARTISCLVRGVDPKPGAYAFHGDKRIKLYRPRITDMTGSPGEVLGLEEGALVVAAGSGAVAFSEVQPEGKRRMDARSFWAGRHLDIGDVLS